MSRISSTGECMFCSKTFGKRAMITHLQKCPQRETAKPKGSGRSSRQTELVHLLVEGNGMPEYWLHLEIPSDATLENLDQFLRDIWLECCGHLSAFEIDGQRYSISPIEEGFFGGEFYEEDLDHALSETLREGLVFSHEYDFGSTTHLTLKVLGKRQGKAKGKTVQLLAQNNPPDHRCKCGKPAIHICTECMYTTRQCLFCEECGEKHSRHNEMFLPVINSPRMGVCGYTGVPY